VLIYVSPLDAAPFQIYAITPLRYATLRQRHDYAAAAYYFSAFDILFDATLPLRFSLIMLRRFRFRFRRYAAAMLPPFRAGATCCRYAFRCRRPAPLFSPLIWTHPDGEIICHPCFFAMMPAAADAALRRRFSLSLAAIISVATNADDAAIATMLVICYAYTLFRCRFTLRHA